MREHELEGKVLKTEPSAWELLRFVITRLPEETQEALSNDLELLSLVVAVRGESGEDIKNLRKIAIKSRNLNAIEKLGQMLNPPLTEKEIIKLWVSDSIKKIQTAELVN